MLGWSLNASGGWATNVNANVTCSCVWLVYFFPSLAWYRGWKDSWIFWIYLIHMGKILKKMLGKRESESVRRKTMLSAKKKPSGSLGCFDFHLKKTSKFCSNCCIRSHLFGISWHRLHLCPALLLFLLPCVRLRSFSSWLVTEADWLVGERKLTASGICWNFKTDLKTLLVGGWQAGVLRAHLKIWEIQPVAWSNAVSSSPIIRTYFFFSHISKHSAFSFLVWLFATWHECMKQQNTPLFSFLVQETKILKV